MGINTLVASTSTSSTTLLPASTITVPLSATLYSVTQNFGRGVYTISCVSSTIAKVDFFDATGPIGSTAVTSAGTVSYNLSSPATGFFIYIDTGSSILVSISQTSNTVPISGISGTLDTLTNSQTYTQTGSSYVLVVGAGGGGGSGYDVGGMGGGSGGVIGGFQKLNGNVSVTIGTGGNGGVGYASSGSGGGATVFGNITANGGGPGNRANGGTAAGNNVGNGGSAGEGGGRGGAGNSTNVGGFAAASPASPLPFVKIGTTGGGGGGVLSGNNLAGGSGAGSGIGTGGNGGTQSNNGNSGTGYGAGGGGGGGTGNSISGGSGSQGVVYVLRF